VFAVATCAALDPEGRVPRKKGSRDKNFAIPWPDHTIRVRGKGMNPGGGGKEGGGYAMTSSSLPPAMASHSASTESQTTIAVHSLKHSSRQRLLKARFNERNKKYRKDR